MLYESLTGSVPFSAASHLAVATMHVRNEIPDVQQRRPEVSAALAAVVERATAKSLGRRYARAAELIAELEEALAIETARTGSADGREATVVLRSLPSARERARAAARPPPGGRSRRRRSLAIAAVAAIVVLALDAHPPRHRRRRPICPARPPR